MFSTVAVSICIHTNNARRFHFLHTLSSIYCLQIFENGNSDWYEVIPHCSFDFLFVFQLLSHVRIFVTPWTAAHQPPLSFTISWSLPKLVPIELVMLYNHLILCHLLLLLPSIFPNRVLNQVYSKKKIPLLCKLFHVIFLSFQGLINVATLN